MLEHHWTFLLTAADSVAPAKQWRRRLAAELKKATEAVFAAVFTCPPNDPLRAQVDVFPDTYLQTIHRIHSGYLPRIERASAGMAQAPATHGRAYAPLATTEHEELARALREDALVPAGVHDLVNAFFVDDAKRTLGWLVLGTSTPATEVLERAANPISFVARQAARTLQSALDLAAACGAALESSEEHALSQLSPRERQVVALTARGLSDANIAARLGIGEETVGSHLRRIFRKLGVRSRVDLATRFGSTARREFLLGD